MGGPVGTMLPRARHGCKYPGPTGLRFAGAPPARIAFGEGSGSRGNEPMAEVQQNIAALLSEERVFEPSADFVARALVKDRSIYERAEADHEAFWAEQAERLTWFRRWESVMDWSPPWVKWFQGGKLNASYNCLDRHVEAGGGDKVAYHWEGEPGEQRTITYKELLDEVSRFANALKSLGVARGDRVAIYLGMVPELPVAMLACARIGAPHSVVFGGFSADSLRDRINDAQAKVLITQDGGYRRGTLVPLKANADEALEGCPSIEHVVTVRRAGNEHGFTPGRDHWYHELLDAQEPDCPPEEMDAEDPLYILYTSGTTGKPKGIVHTTGGYLTGVIATHRLIFDIHDDDVFWCAADIGWVTGHSYIVYGPLANHTTGVIYEGAPDWPDKDRIWSIAERTRSRSCTRLPPPSGRSCDGARSSPRSTTCHRSACSARWASPSTRRRGCGTGSTSAASGARWSIRGGRRRRDAS